MLYHGLEKLFPAFLRNGGVLFTLFSALICDCIYSTKTIFTGRLLLESSQRILDKSPGDEDAALAARTLYESAVKHQQHAGSLWALSVWTGAATFWAGRDVLAFRGLTPLELERYVSRMPFPMFRASSLGAFSLGTAAAWFITGDIRFQPPAPPGRPVGGGAS
mmetsp:Transcript_35098/g.107740  ORF Transcript_35098/g.107740 Transcript_35098/m.107740 type:complete len:163 (+) Transcript_35098:246-734(+)